MIHTKFRENRPAGSGEEDSSSTFLVNGDAYILPYRLHTYLGLNISGSPYLILVVFDLLILYKST